jgi:3-oxoacyl-[acyl-carrier-protein] synthase-3
MFSQIIGTGSALPKQVIANKDLSRQIGLSEDEIEKKTGIVTRRWVSPEETTATLAIDAAKAALQSAHLPASAIDLIVVSTSSPDMLFPSVACLVQKGLACRAVPAFDINASCSGFLYALTVGDQFLKGGKAKNALIIASEVKSIYLNRNHPQTASLFGDGAGAVVLSNTPEVERGQCLGLMIRSIHVFSGGPGKQLITLPAGGSRCPLTPDTIQKELHLMQMNGTRLFRLAISKIDEAISYLLKENRISLDEIDLFLFHQANARILEAVLKRRGIPQERHHMTIQKFGNTSSSSLPIALDDAIKSGRVKQGTRIGLCAFGGGFTWGAALLTAT